MSECVGDLNLEYWATWDSDKNCNTLNTVDHKKK